MSSSPTRRLRPHEVLFLAAVVLFAGVVARTEEPVRPTAPVVSYAVAGGDGCRVDGGAARCR